MDGLPSWAPSIIAVAVALSLGPEPPDSLENKMRRSVFAVVLSTTVAAPALAGTVITSEVSAPNVAGHSIVRTTSVRQADSSGVGTMMSTRKRTSRKARGSTHC